MAGTSTVRFKDLGIEKFKGPEQDFTAWLHEFDDGVELGNYSWQSKVALFKSTLDGNCKLQAAAHVKKFKEDNQQRRNEEIDDYYERVYKALCKSYTKITHRNAQSFSSSSASNSPTINFKRHHRVIRGCRSYTDKGTHTQTEVKKNGRHEKPA